MKARFRTSTGKATVIQVYAPTASSTEEEIEEFYKTLQMTIQRTSSQDMLIVMGDFNAKVGKDWSTWKGAIGKFGHGKKNERGERLLNFCLANSLKIMNTAFYQRKDNRKWTWESPDGKTKNMIDFVLINNRWKSCVTMCRAFPKPDVGSDHQLVIAGVRIKLKKACTTTAMRRFDVEKLKDVCVRQQYYSRIRNKSANITEDKSRTVEETWNEIKIVYTDVAKSVLGYRKSQKTAPWISKEILELSDQRKQLKADRNKSSELRKEYNLMTRKIKRKSKECKQQWIEAKCQKVEDSQRKHDTRTLYKTANEICGTFVPKLPTVKSKAGETLAEKEQIKGRWKEYYEGLYNEQNPVDETVLDELPPTNTAEHMDDFLEEEVAAAIKNLKKGKSPGEDNITAEMLQAGEECSVKMMHTLCNKIYQEEQCPADWGKAVIVPLFKKGDKKECNNYRGISLLSVPGKVYTRVLQQRMKRYVEDIVAEEQAGFRYGRGTVDQLFVIRQLSEKFFEKNRTLYNNFIDFKQAFDSVWQLGLWKVLRNYGIPEKLVVLLEDMYRKSVSAVRVDGELTDWFKVTVGVRQGCNLSPYLFNLLLEAMMQEAMKSVDAGVNVSGQLVNNLRFADDIDLITESPEQLQVLTDKVEESSKRFGLKINVSKTKVMTIGKSHKELNINLENAKLEQVTDFVYLGGLVSDDGECRKDIQRRTGLASAMVGKLSKIWRSASISIKTKVKVYETIVIPVFLYGAECWRLRKNDERKILSTEMGWLRRIMGVSRLQHIRNDEIRKQMGKQDTLCAKVQRKRLKWFGHTTRMDDKRLPARALHCHIEGARSRGRQPKTWMDNVKEDLKEHGLDIRTATELARDRQRWRQLVQPHRQQR